LKLHGNLSYPVFYITKKARKQSGEDGTQTRVTIGAAGVLRASPISANVGSCSHLTEIEIPSEQSHMNPKNDLDRIILEWIARQAMINRRRIPAREKVSSKKRGPGQNPGPLFSLNSTELFLA